MGGVAGGIRVNAELFQGHGENQGKENNMTLNAVVDLVHFYRGVLAFSEEGCRGVPVLTKAF